MDFFCVEAKYPLTFRKKDAELLGEHLRHRHSIDLTGMKRVGISNFLRFFLYNERAKESFVSKTEKHLFVSIDLNDLVERELYAFWALTFKRLLDETVRSNASEHTKQKIGDLFLYSIQTKDLFLLIDGIRQSLIRLVSEDILPTLFLLRFDRIKDVVTPAFFDNLEGLRDSTHGKLAYVFTSFRNLGDLSPQAIDRSHLSTFCYTLSIKPATVSDMKIIFEQYNQRYHLDFSSSQAKDLFTLVGGNVQYLQLGLVILNEQGKSDSKNMASMQDIFQQDERTNLFSEELWESLLPKEKDLILAIVGGNKIGDEERRAGQYIFETGFIIGEKNREKLFSPLFEQYIRTLAVKKQQREPELVFSKKEHLLYTLLERKVGQICERDEIIEAVWPENQEFGVSDWSIDRLMARVRSKLKKQTSPFEIRTIRTRGYMLTERV
ncbi:MAG: helix-turn-helix domain-containing protein [Candidatus Levybacteria bacterium]|nr:helix-turn-helix domain-containing protein [Candidatus Levybacteria bacterium]